MDIQKAASLVFLTAVVAYSLWQMLRRDSEKRPHRVSWWRAYGSFHDPIGSVWIDRDYEHEQRQRKLDSSQNVMTRLL